MSTAVLFGKKATKIGVLQLDVTRSESHNYENQVSRWPVESGATIVDNIRQEPERLTIEGLISNHPINVRFEDLTNIVQGNSNESQSLTVARDDTPTHVETALNILLDIQGRLIQGQPVAPLLVDVVTGLRVYKNMAMTTFRVSRNARTGQALPFTAEFIEVKTADIAFIEGVPQLEPQTAFKDKASTQKPKGKQTAKTAGEDLSNQTSLIKDRFNQIGRLFGG